MEQEVQQQSGIVSLPPESQPKKIAHTRSQARRWKPATFCEKPCQRTHFTMKAVRVLSIIQDSSN